MIKRVMTGLIVTLTSGWLLAASAHEEAVADRIMPIGKVCVQGEECASAAVAASAAASGPMSGDQVYQKSCFGCHGTGAAGAPKVGDAAAWSSRRDKGLDTLVQNAINGINAMPPRGTCSSCSDDEIQAAVEHMLDNS